MVEPGRAVFRLPSERTQLLDNLGHIRREVGPITPELSDALADHMNIRRGEVHEVVSFTRSSRCRTDAVRVCTGPICDCYGARELLGAHARSDRGRMPRPLRPRARHDPWRRDRSGGHALDKRRPGPRARPPRRALADYEKRGGLELLRNAAPHKSASSRSSRPRGSPDTAGRDSRPESSGRQSPREPGPRHVVVNADEGEPGTIKDRYVMELRPHLFLEGVADCDAFRGGDRWLVYLREEYATARTQAVCKGSRSFVPRGFWTALARARSRRRRVHRGRGDGDAGVDGGPARDAAAPSPVSGPGRLSRAADPHQQRGDARASPGHPAKRRRVVGRARKREAAGTRLWSVSGAVRQSRLLRGAERRHDAELVDDYAGGFFGRERARSSQAELRAESFRPARSTRG